MMRSNTLDIDETVIRLMRGMALLGSGSGILILLWVAAQQIDFMGIVQGDISWNIALRLGADALPFLLLLLIPCLISFMVGLRPPRYLLWMAGIWLATGIILFYGLYQARFSVGPLLFPAAILTSLAGLAALWLKISRNRSSNG